MYNTSNALHDDVETALQAALSVNAFQLLGGGTERARRKFESRSDGKTSPGAREIVEEGLKRDQCGAKSLWEFRMKGNALREKPFLFARNGSR